MTATATKQKTIEFEKVMKDFKKFASKSESRPALQNVEYYNGYLTATDGHRLIRLNTEYVTGIPDNMMQYNPKEMKVIDNPDQYPDTSRLIPQDGSSTAILNNNNIKEFQDHIKEVKKVVNKEFNKVFQMEFTQSDLTITGKPLPDEKDKETYNQTFSSVYVEGEEITLKANAQFINDALMTVKKLNKLNNNEMLLMMNGRMRPIHFRKEDVFDIIVLPVRSY